MISADPFVTVSSCQSLLVKNPERFPSLCWVFAKHDHGHFAGKSDPFESHGATSGYILNFSLQAHSSALIVAAPGRPVLLFREGSALPVFGRISTLVFLFVYRVCELLFHPELF